jgi:hypothetical protein
MRQPYKRSVPVDEANRATLCPVVTFDEIHSPSTDNRAVVAADRVQEVSIERQVGYFACIGTCACQQSNTNCETNESTVTSHNFAFRTLPMIRLTIREFCLKNLIYIRRLPKEEFLSASIKVFAS